MVSIRVSLFVIILVILAVITFTYITLSNQNLTNSTTVDGLSTYTNTTSNVNVTPDTIGEPFGEELLTLPPRENFLNFINWSNYPLLSNPYIHDYLVADPTSVIDHKFLYVVLVVELKDASNKTEIFNQMSGVVLEERKLLGLNSAPTVWGTADGVWVYYANLLPNETTVHNSFLA